MHNIICSCGGKKDYRAIECRKCRLNNRHPCLGRGKNGAGRSINSAGYVVLNRENKRYEHRKVMEEFLGRQLSIKEHVHHVNGNKSDNRIENLQLMSHSEHAYEHMIDRAKEMSVLGHKARWGVKNSSL